MADPTVFSELGKGGSFAERSDNFEKSHKAEVIIEGHLGCHDVVIIVPGGPGVGQVQLHARVVAVNQHVDGDTVSDGGHERFENQQVSHHTTFAKVHGQYSFVVVLHISVYGGIQDPTAVAGELNKHGVAGLALFGERFEGFGMVECKMSAEKEILSA